MDDLGIREEDTPCDFDHPFPMDSEMQHTGNDQEDRAPGVDKIPGQATGQLKAPSSYKSVNLLNKSIFKDQGRKTYNGIREPPPIQPVDIGSIDPGSGD